MKTKFVSIVLLALLLVACKKTESTEANDNYAKADYTTIDSATNVSDSISMAATQTVKDRQFVKTAEVNMEVKDVYDATISIEKQLKTLGGFVTKSQLEAQTLSEDTYNTSDETGVLIRKFQNQNNMQVRVPSQKLGEFLDFVNDKKVFLNARIISAEDVSANIKLAKLEAERQAKTKSNISQLKTGKDKVNLDNDNMSDANLQKYSDDLLADNLRFSTVDIFIKEPKTSVAKIPIVNIKNVDNEYKYNFFFEAKNAFIEGYYLIQSILVFLISVWPILLIMVTVVYFLRRHKNASPKID